MILERSFISPWAKVVLCALGFVLVSSGCSSCIEGELSTRPATEDGERVVTPGGTAAEANDYFLVASGPTTYTVDVGKEVKFGVFLYSKSTGEPVQQERLQFELVDGALHGVLAARNKSTGSDGLAEMTMRALDAAGTATIKVSHPLANEIEFKINVMSAATADIQVNMINTNPTIMRLKDIDVRLYPGVGYSCNEFFPLRQQTEPLEHFQVSTVNQEVFFNGLNPNKKYIVTAIARGQEHGQLAASGCVEDVRLSPDEITTVDLGLVLIPMNPVGRYEAISYWDFSQAVEDSGPVGATIVRILNVFQNPGDAIYNEVIELVKFAVGGIISGAIDTFLSTTGLDDQFKNLIDTTIENNDALRRVRDAGRDVRNVIAHLEVTSQLTIGKVSSSYEFSGTDNWLGVTVYWRWNCPDNAPADCGAIPLLVDGAGDVADLGILSSHWDGRVVAYDQLQIDQHPLTLRYGRLIIYILNEVIIPELTDGNASSLSEAFGYWVGCDSIAEGLTGSDREACALGACIYADDVENFCNSAVSTVFGFADAYVRTLEFDIGLSVGGEAKMIEENSDGFVDRIVDGTYEGFMSTSGSVSMDGGPQQGASASPVSATWSATRVDFETNNL